VWQVREDLLLQIAGQGQEAVGGGGDRHTQDRRQNQQHQITPAAQQGDGGPGRAGVPGGAGSGWFAGIVTNPSSRLPAWRRSYLLAR